jgi:hypothetical protein
MDEIHKLLREGFYIDILKRSDVAVGYVERFYTG